LHIQGFTAAYRKGIKLKMEVKDSNGNLLKDGDSVILIKSLPVKGTSITLKKGMVIKNIRLTEDDGEVDCKADKMRIVLKTAFLKKG
jgi:protein PhnA